MKRGFFNFVVKFGKWFNWEVKKCLSCNTKFLKETKKCDCEICKKIDGYFKLEEENKNGKRK